MNTYNNILVVCAGNICRSPVAEAMFKKQYPDRLIQSAGLSALQGQGVESVAAELARADGLDVSQHSARQINNALIQWADLILVMSQQQRDEIRQKVPEAMGKTLLLGHWLNTDEISDLERKEIPDPYKKSREVFEHVHRTMLQAVSLWAQKL